ncbi:MAG: hypothetical protein KatS3mg010_2107 [Acidimicrobiia bacterium]|nr:MAG: hypothetical protein KatS3mg010_2107 [Acidimicrobiia bacterium]
MRGAIARERVAVTPARFNPAVPVPRPPAARFAAVARRLGAATRAAGLTVPAFRTPPRRPGAPRTIRRLPGGPVVAVTIRGRTFAEVVRDMVDGVVVANRLEGEAAERVRASLLRAVGASRDPAAA